MENKLEKLFFELSEDEFSSLCLSEKDIIPQSDKEMRNQIKKNVLGRIKTENRKGNSIIMKNKRIKTILIAAALIVTLALSVSAGYRFILPKQFSDNLAKDVGLNLDSIKLIVDTEKANEGEISIINKTVKSAGYIVTFEAIAESTDCIKTSLFKDEEVTVKDGRYAILTLRREDGKQVMYNEDENDTLYASDIGYLVMVGGYAPNPCMMHDLYEGSYFYEEENVVYCLFNISLASVFADHDISIAFTNKMVLTPELFDVKENGKFGFKDSYNGIKAIFDLDLPDNLADKKLQGEFIATGTFNKVSTQEEFDNLFK